MSGIWIFAEQRAGELQRVSLEVTCSGRMLADKVGEKLSAVVLGHEIEPLAVTLSQYGADEVYWVEDALLAQYNSDFYVSAMTDLMKQYTPSMVLFGATSIGRDLAPRIAARIKAGIVTECIALKIDRDGLIVTKPIYDGKMFATISCRSAPTYIVTIRPGAMAINPPAESQEVKAIKVTPILGAETSRIKFLGVIPADPKTIDLTEAEIIVAGGRGVGGAENFHLIEELADQLGGSVGGTRPAVDAGWLPPERQIGLTGKFVSPKVFIACGISGQYHHTAGIKDSLTIVAINTDSNAAIFKLADLGIVEDLREVIPAVIQQLQARRNEEQ